ncbi:MAG: chemotaxis protein CheX [Phycisphaeraceae bacterium]|nr:chemotaxis protein CheX [Phycisphaeraceae bacterium]
MTRDLTAGRLAALAIETLERTAFVPAEVVTESDASRLPLTTHYAAIEYGGSRSGSVVIGASDGFLRDLASSLLGVERDEIELRVHGTDAIRELANIIGGSIVWALGGETCPFSLGLPVLLSEDEGRSRDAGGLHCDLESEGERLRVRWIPA